MVEAGERGSDETQATGERLTATGNTQPPSRRMPPLKLMKKELLPRAGEVKGDLPSPQRETRGGKPPLTKFPSYRTQQAIAQFGKSARHPLCLAALRLWQVKDETHKYAKDAESLGELLVKARRLKEQARASYERLYKEGKQKGAIQAAALLREIEEHLPKLQTGYQACVKLFTIWCEQFYPLAIARFERECNAVDRAKDVKALKALQRVKKRWDDNANGMRLKDGDSRTLEILKLLRDKTFKATAAKAGSAAYIEAARGGDRLLSDEFWSGRLTIREIHTHLLRIGGSCLAGDKEGKEIRRLLGRLGIRPAEDQRGRKWKPPLPKKQEPKRPRGRTRTKPEIKSMSLEAIQAMLAKTAKQGDGLRNQQIYKAGDESGLKWARKVLKSIDREIAQLVQRWGGRRGKFVY